MLSSIEAFYLLMFSYGFSSQPNLRDTLWNFNLLFEALTYNYFYVFTNFRFGDTKFIIISPFPFKFASLKISSQRDLISLFSFLYHLHLQLQPLMAIMAILPFDSSFVPFALAQVWELVALELLLQV